MPRRLSLEFKTDWPNTAKALAEFEDGEVTQVSDTIPAPPGSFERTPPMTQSPARVTFEETSDAFDAAMKRLSETLTGNVSGAILDAYIAFYDALAARGIHG